MPDTQRPPRLEHKTVAFAGAPGSAPVYPPGTQPLPRTNISGVGDYSVADGNYAFEPFVNAEGEGIAASIVAVTGIRDDVGDKIRPGWFTKTDRKSTRLNSSHLKLSRMPSSA